MKAIASKTWNTFLDIVFPHRRVVAEIISMSPEMFSSNARRAEGRAGKHIISLFDYGDPMVRAAVWELKYRGNSRIVHLLGEILHDEMLGFLEEYAPLTNFTDPLLIPIPLSKRRERERGFNQCSLLADAIARADGGANFASSRALRKTKDTQSQTKAESRQKRMQNLKGCFTAERTCVEGRNIILLDDVATTGATLEEARRALRRAGARQIIAFTVAH